MLHGAVHSVPHSGGSGDANADGENTGVPSPLIPTLSSSRAQGAGFPATPEDILIRNLLQAIGFPAGQLPSAATPTIASAPRPAPPLSTPIEGLSLAHKSASTLDSAVDAARTPLGDQTVPHPAAAPVTSFPSSAFAPESEAPPTIPSHQMSTSGTLATPLVAGASAASLSSLPSTVAFPAWAVPPQPLFPAMWAALPPPVSAATQAETARVQALAAAAEAAVVAAKSTTGMDAAPEQPEQQRQQQPHPQQQHSPATSRTAMAVLEGPHTPPLPPPPSPSPPPAASLATPLPSLPTRPSPRALVSPSHILPLPPPSTRPLGGVASLGASSASAPLVAGNSGASSTLSSALATDAAPDIAAVSTYAPLPPAAALHLTPAEPPSLHTSVQALSGIPPISGGQPTASTGVVLPPSGVPLAPAEAVALLLGLISVATAAVTHATLPPPAALSTDAGTPALDGKTSSPPLAPLGGPFPLSPAANTLSPASTAMLLPPEKSLERQTLSPHDAATHVPEPAPVPAFMPAPAISAVPAVAAGHATSAMTSDRNDITEGQAGRSDKCGEAVVIASHAETAEQHSSAGSGDADTPTVLAAGTHARRGAVELAAMISPSHAVAPHGTPVLLRWTEPPLSSSLSPFISATTATIASASPSAIAVATVSSSPTTPQDSQSLSTANMATAPTASASDTPSLPHVRLRGVIAAPVPPLFCATPPRGISPFVFPSASSAAPTASSLVRAGSPTRPRSPASLEQQHQHCERGVVLVGVRQHVHRVDVESDGDERALPISLPPPPRAHKARGDPGRHHQRGSEEETRGLLSNTRSTDRSSSNAEEGGSNDGSGCSGSGSGSRDGGGSAAGSRDEAGISDRDGDSELLDRVEWASPPQPEGVLPVRLSIQPVEAARTTTAPGAARRHRRRRLSRDRSNAGSHTSVLAEELASKSEELVRPHPLEHAPVASAETAASHVKSPKVSVPSLTPTEVPEQPAVVLMQEAVPPAPGSPNAPRAPPPPPPPPQPPQAQKAFAAKSRLPPLRRPALVPLHLWEQHRHAASSRAAGFADADRVQPSGTMVAAAAHVRGGGPGAAVMRALLSTPREIRSGGEGANTAGEGGVTTEEASSAAAQRGHELGRLLAILKSASSSNSVGNAEAPAPAVIPVATPATSNAACIPRDGSAGEGAQASMGMLPHPPAAAASSAESASPVSTRPSSPPTPPSLATPLSALPPVFVLPARRVTSAAAAAGAPARVAGRSADAGEPASTDGAASPPTAGRHVSFGPDAVVSPSFSPPEVPVSASVQPTTLFPKPHAAAPSPPCSPPPVDSHPADVCFPGGSASLRMQAPPGPAGASSSRNEAAAATFLYVSPAPRLPHGVGTSSACRGSGYEGSEELGDTAGTLRADNRGKTSWRALAGRHGSGRSATRGDDHGAGEGNGENRTSNDDGGGSDSEVGTVSSSSASTWLWASSHVPHRHGRRHATGPAPPSAAAVHWTPACASSQPNDFTLDTEPTTWLPPPVHTQPPQSVLPPSNSGDVGVAVKCARLPWPPVAAQAVPLAARQQDEPGRPSEAATGARSSAGERAIRRACVGGGHINNSVAEGNGLEHEGETAHEAGENGEEEEEEEDSDAEALRLLIRRQARARAAAGAYVPYNLAALAPPRSPSPRTSRPALSRRSRTIAAIAAAVDKLRPVPLRPHAASGAAPAEVIEARGKIVAKGATRSAPDISAPPSGQAAQLEAMLREALGSSSDEDGGSSHNAHRTGARCGGKSDLSERNLASELPGASACALAIPTAPTATPDTAHSPDLAAAMGNMPASRPQANLVIRAIGQMTLPSTQPTGLQTSQDAPTPPTRELHRRRDQVSLASAPPLLRSPGYTATADSGRVSPATFELLSEQFELAARASPPPLSHPPPPPPPLDMPTVSDIGAQTQVSQRPILVVPFAGPASTTAAPATTLATAPLLSSAASTQCGPLRQHAGVAARPYCDAASALAFDSRPSCPIAALPLSAGMSQPSCIRNRSEIRREVMVPRRSPPKVRAYTPEQETEDAEVDARSVAVGLPPPPASRHNRPQHHRHRHHYQHRLHSTPRGDGDSLLAGVDAFDGHAFRES